MPTAGHLLLILATVSALATTLSGLLRPDRARWLRVGQSVSAATGLAAFVVLDILVAGGDQRVGYALQHAPPVGAPVGYRIAAVWAGQSGGLLLWCIETALVGLALSARRQARAVAVLCGIQGCLLLLATLSRPFAPPGPASEVGLNPLLQHPMMLVHPPMLFLGYALLAIPFALTVGALIDRRPRPWLDDVRVWLIVAWLALTAGNGFGALWAYKTFGWGGFWAWDPVENTSFVPWMLCAAGIHAVWLARFDATWRRPAAAYALGGFLTVLYGSFLARSGLLAGASVHAYVEANGLYVWALGLLLFGGLALALAVLLRVWREWGEQPPDGSGPDATNAGVWAMVCILLLVLGGMSLPMLGEAPGPSTYNAAVLPFAFVLMGMLAVRVHPRSGLTRSARAVLAVALAGVAGSVLASIRLSASGGMLIAMPLIFGPLTVIASASVAVRSIAALIARARTMRRVGAEVAHLGLALMLLGALISGYQTRTATVFFPVGAQRDLGGHTVMVDAVERPSELIVAATATVDGRQGRLEIENNDRFNIELRRAFITRLWWGDIYLSPMAVLVEPESAEMGEMPAGAMLEASFKPGMPLLWGGMWLMALGLLLALLGRGNAAPVAD